MIKVTADIIINETELKFSYIRSSGPGGQNVNKVSSAVQLRFNVIDSPSLTENVRTRLLTLRANQINHEGDLIIKSDRYRTQQRNKQDALERLLLILTNAATIPKKRKPTRPTRASKQKRLSQKKIHAINKSTRRYKPNSEE